MGRQLTCHLGSIRSCPRMRVGTIPTVWSEQELVKGIGRVQRLGELGPHINIPFDSLVAVRFGNILAVEGGGCVHFCGLRWLLEDVPEESAHTRFTSG